jgi:hypothetical protein
VDARAQQQLAERSPAEVLRVLGDEGLDATLGHLARIAPSTPVGDLRMPSVEQLRVSLRQTLSEDTRALADRARRAPRRAADLSDFDFLSAREPHAGCRQVPLGCHQVALRAALPVIPGQDPLQD